MAKFLKNKLYLYNLSILRKNHKNSFFIFYFTCILDFITNLLKSRELDISYKKQQKNIFFLLIYYELIRKMYLRY